ncbi:MAG: citramalate synthase [Desulfohalobiaceae bacterium]|nr:citramalate synthase [Desulfohalobiaceae bacterium]
MKQKIFIYDTTLRDGTQAEEIHFNTADKIRLARKLDDLGLDYIEGGWPGSNPTDRQFFQEVKNYDFKNAKISAFGSTHNPKSSPDRDSVFQLSLEAGVEVITLFGKAWDIHVREALRISNERNLELIHDSLAYIRPRIRELFFDAEHFFDGFKADREFALACLKQAYQAGADTIILCDTNGGTLTEEIKDIFAAVQQEFPDMPLGIHAHNDSELAVANSLQAVKSGAGQVQGTMNGYGERCGNANLTSIIPALELKMNRDCLPDGHLEKLRNAALYVSEVANVRPFIRQPFVGKAAFAHKGGIHVSAVRRNPLTYEHISPETVGNKRRVLLSDLSGQSNILFKAKQFGIPLEKTDPAVREVLTRVKELESIGYEYAVAEASFELLLNRAMGKGKKYYTLLGFRVTDAKNKEDDTPFSEATVMIQVGGEIEHTAATGDGPVNALDNALRKGLEIFYPSLKEMTLLDFKVRVLTPNQNLCPGTASRVRVLIESGDHHDRWVTVGVSENIVEASWQALVDSINYKLFKDDKSR